MQVAEQALATGPKPLRRFAQVGRQLVILFLLLTQFGFCCAYSIFVAETMGAVLSNLTDGRVSMGLHLLMLIELPLMIFYCFVRNLKTLSIFSTLANALQSVGLILIFVNLMQALPPSWDRPAFGSLERLPLYFGTVVYAFEGLCTEFAWTLVQSDSLLTTSLTSSDHV